MKPYRLENRTGHFKFYEIWAGAYVNTETDIADKAFVGTRWGKIGTEGQTKLIEFEGEGCKAKAMLFVQNKIEEKLSRGYEITKAPDKDDPMGAVAVTEVTEPQLTFQM
jgi:predicted DNA-binding WGR domain protein